MRDYLVRNMNQVNSELAYIDPEFETTVISHIMGNYMDNCVFPLYLAIHGPRGEGKTFQTLYTCQQYGIQVYYVSGAELSGSFEADSVSSIEKNRDDAILRFRREGQHSVFIIDDFHLSVASVDAGVSRTVNSQLLTGWLMNQADRATVGYRIPFILLGNDFVNLYAPLTRDGRMDFYEWKPNADKKMVIISRHFEDIIENKDQPAFEAFVKEHIDQPISFFAELKKDLFKRQIYDALQRCSRKDHKLIMDTINRVSVVPVYDQKNIICRLNDLASARILQAKSRYTIHEERR